MNENEINKLVNLIVKDIDKYIKSDYGINPIPFFDDNELGITPIIKSRILKAVNKK